MCLIYRFLKGLECRIFSYTKCFMKGEKMAGRGPQRDLNLQHHHGSDQAQVE